MWCSSEPGKVLRSIRFSLSASLTECNSPAGSPTYLKGDQPYDGINGEYRRLADSNVYYKRSKTTGKSAAASARRGTAMWWYNHKHSGGMWMVGPADAVGSESAWAFGRCNHAGRQAHGSAAVSKRV